MSIDSFAICYVQEFGNALMTCIDLIKEFKRCASTEHELLDVYKELIRQVETYMCSLLDQVRPTFKI